MFELLDVCWTEAFLAMVRARLANSGGAASLKEMHNSASADEREAAAWALVHVVVDEPVDPRRLP